MKIVILLFLFISDFSFAKTCISYFQLPQIIDVKSISKKQLETLRDLVNFELEAHAENNPLLKNQKLLEFQERLNEILQTGISIEVYYKILNALTRAQYLNSQAAIEKVYEQQFIAESTQKYSQLETEILQNYQVDNLTEALFLALEAKKTERSMRKLSLHKNSIQTILSNEFFLKYKIDTQAQFKEAQDTLLHAAVAAENSQAVQILIRLGAKLDSIDHEGNTPLHYAAWSGNLEITQILLNQHAKANATRKDNKTALHLVLQSPKQKDQLLMSQLLINHGAKVYLADTEGMTPLHYASKTANAKLLYLLIDQGTNINATNIRGETPLHLAVEGNASSGVQALLHRKARIQIKTLSGKTPFQIAIENKNPHIVKLLRRAGAKE